MFSCKICQAKKKTRQSLTAHVWRSHTPDGLSHDPNTGKKRTDVIWNKGLSKTTSKGVKKFSDTLVRKYESGEITPSFLGKTLSESTREKISKKLSLNNRGGRCKWFVVNGISVQGTWERDTAIKLSEMNVKWQKVRTSQHRFKFTINGITKNYTPDFYLPEYDLYLEIKGHCFAK